MDFAALFLALRDGGFSGCYSFEFSDAAPDYDGNVWMLRQSITFLRSLCDHPGERVRKEAGNIIR